MGVAESDKSIAMAVLKEKHKNGQVDEIHRQMFYELKKDKCEICDLPSKLYFQMQKSMLRYAANIDLKYSHSERFNGIDSRYDPKKAAPPVAVVCRDCGAQDEIGYDSVYGPPYKRVVRLLPGGGWDWQCSKCWFDKVGQYI